LLVKDPTGGETCLLKSYSTTLLFICNVLLAQLPASHEQSIQGVSRNVIYTYHSFIKRSRCKWGVL